MIVRDRILNHSLETKSQGLFIASPILNPLEAVKGNPLATAADATMNAGNGAAAAATGATQLVPAAMQNLEMLQAAVAAPGALASAQVALNSEISWDYFDITKIFL